MRWAELGQQAGRVRSCGCEGSPPAPFRCHVRGSRRTSRANLTAQGLAPFCLFLRLGSPETEEGSPEVQS